MARKTPVRILPQLRSAGMPALAIIFMGFFGYYAVMGPNGLLAYRDYQRQIAARKLEFAQLDKSRAEIANRVVLLDPRHVDPDLADEVTRAKLGVVKPNEHVYELPQATDSAH